MAVTSRTEDMNQDFVWIVLLTGIILGAYLGVTITVLGYEVF